MGMLLLLLSSFILLGCPNRAKLPRVQTIFVEKAQIKATATPGWYEVTDGWLAARMKYEQALQKLLEAAQEALKRCQKNN